MNEREGRGRGAEPLAKGRRAAGVRLSLPICSLTVAAAGALVYSNSFGGVFLLDDYGHIVTSQTIQSITPLSKHLEDFRPLVHLSLAINYAISGPNVWSYHLFNLAIHILAGLTLFGITRRTFAFEHIQPNVNIQPVVGALVVALLWVVHPLQTQAVTYVIQRGESMMGLFYLLTLYCVIRGAVKSQKVEKSKSRNGWYGLAILNCAAGMFSKEAMVTAPVTVFLCDAVFLSRSWRGALRKRWGLYLSLWATWAILVYLGLFHDIMYGSKKHGPDLGFQVPGMTPLTYALTQPGVILHYIRLCFWPYPQCFDYGWEAVSGWREAVLPGLVIVMMLAATGWALWKQPALGFLGAWVFIILAPTSSIVPIKVFAFEHRMYLPLAAIIVLTLIVAAWICQRVLRAVPRRASAIRVGSVVLVVLAALALGTRTLARNADYTSPVRMWADVVAQRPRNVRAWCSLGVALSVEKRLEEAVRAYERALAIDPASEEAHINIGNDLARLRRYSEAIPHYHEGLKTARDDDMLHHSLAIALEHDGKRDAALIEYRETLRLNPAHPFARFNMGLALKVAGRWEDALSAFRASLRMNPGDVTARYQVAVCLVRLNKRQEAATELQAVLRLDPPHAEAKQLLNAISPRP